MNTTKNTWIKHARLAVTFAVCIVIGYVCIRTVIRGVTLQFAIKEALYMQASEEAKQRKLAMLELAELNESSAWKEGYPVLRPSSWKKFAETMKKEEDLYAELSLVLRIKKRSYERFQRRVLPW